MEYLTPGLRTLGPNFHVLDAKFVFLVPVDFFKIKLYLFMLVKLIMISVLEFFRHL